MCVCAICSAFRSKNIIFLHRLFWINRQKNEIQKTTTEFSLDPRYNNGSHKRNRLIFGLLKDLLIIIGDRMHLYRAAFVSD